MAKKTIVPLDELHIDDTNAREHNERNRADIKRSLEKFGAARSIVVDADGVVRAGNGTLEEARRAGITEALVIETDGKRLVVVKRGNWSKLEAEGDAVADNGIGDTSEWDLKLLQARMIHLKEASVDLNDLGWMPHEADPLLHAEWQPETPDDSTGDDDVGGRNPRKVNFSETEWAALNAAVAKFRIERKDVTLMPGPLVEALCMKYVNGEVSL